MLDNGSIRQKLGATDNQIVGVDHFIDATLLAVAPH
jgi:hypothetical protein